MLAYRLTGSGLGVAATVAFEIAPVLLLGPVFGLFADRYPRRHVMIAADLGRAALAATLWLPGRIAILYFVAFGLSAGAVAFNPASASMVPDLAQKEDLVSANSLLWTVAVAAQIVLAPLAGLLIATIGIGSAFGLNALSFLVSALLLRGLPATTTDPGRSRGDLVAGVRFVRSNPLLVRLVFVQALAALSAGATGGLLVVLSEQWLGAGPSGFGVLLGAIGVGAAAGPLLLRRYVKARSRTWLFGPLALRGAVDLTLAGIASPVVAAGSLAVYGVGTSTGMIAFQSTLQVEVPARVRGRVFTVFDIVWNSSRLVSLGLGGLLADAVGIRFVYVAAGGLLILAAVAGLLGRRRTEPL